MNMLKAFCRDLEVCYWWDYVPLNLSLLTGQALSGPFTHILADIGPDKFVSYRLTSAFHARMPQSMDDVENAPAVRQRHKRSGGAVRNIYVEEGGTYLELAKAEASLSIPAQVSEFRVEHLLTRHIFQVN